MTDNKRDLFKDGFDESDFNSPGDPMAPEYWMRKVMANKANAILRQALESAQTVEGEQDETSKEIVWADQWPNGWASHTGKLVAVRKVGE